MQSLNFFYHKTTVDTNTEDLIIVIQKQIWKIPAYIKEKGSFW